MNKKKVAFIFGTRPEVIKIFPVYKYFLKDDRYECKLISSGQQKELSEQMLSFFKVKPDIDLQIMKENQSLAHITASILTQLHQILLDIKPDLIFVQGDTNTAFSAALSGFYLNIPVAHIEAGLRSYDIHSPFPEEANRAMISKISALDFAPTETSLEVLIKDGKKKAYLTGNTVVDALKLISSQVSLKEEGYAIGLDIGRKELDNHILLTLHRRELFDDRLQNVLAAISLIAEKNSEIKIICPVHFNPRVKNEVYGKLSHYPNIHLTKPLDYDSLIFLLSRCKFVMTDSGGIQEEAPTFKKPVIVLRDKTERMEGVEAGIAFLTGYNTEEILKQANNLLNPDLYAKIVTSMKNPYGDGKASERIKQIVDSFFKFG